MKKKFIVICLILLVCVAGYFGCRHWQELSRQKAAWDNLKVVLDREINNFGAEAAIVIKRLNRDWQISHNENELYAAASIVKIPIMAACFWAAEEKKVDLNKGIVLQGSDKVGGSGVLKNMPAGSVFSVAQLIELMIAHSDNTAANMLIDLLGFDYLDDLFAKMELKDTNLSRKMMHFRQRSRGVENYTTASDMAQLLEKVYRQKLFNKQVSKSCLELLKQQKINNRIPARLPKDVQVAHKTGREKEICHDVGIVFSDKGDFLICVLTKNKDIAKAKAFIAQAAWHTYNAL